MYKFIFLFLIIINLLLYFLLLKIDNDKQAYTPEKPAFFMPLQIKELEEIDKENFHLEDYLVFIGHDGAYRYTLNESSLDLEITLNDGSKDNYQYDLSYKKEAEPLIHTVYVPIERDNSLINDTYANADKEIKDEEPETIEEEDGTFTFSGYHDISLKLGSSIDDLRYALSKDIISDKALSIDYSEVNTNVLGVYTAYYLVDDTSYSVKVYITE